MSRGLVPVVALLALLLAPRAPAAPPAVPIQVSYQGVLLDTAGEPRSGNVDLTLRIWDALGGGTLVYTQVFTNVPLVDGVFSVQLGPQGSAADTPTDPLTDSLAAALAGDAGATAPERFLEVTVGTEGALLRSQILATPYALRAASADWADAAGIASVASNVTAVNGLDAAVLNQIYDHGNTDGHGPPNADPQEGTQDTDGDGAMNFVDPDNDGDGIPDDVEIAQGSHMNVVTPSLTSLSPSTLLAFAPVPVTLTGLQFDPSMTVSVDGAPLAASGVTATSAQLQLAPGHSLGIFPVFVELPNGERSVDRFLTIVSTPDPGESPPFEIDGTASVAVRGGAQLVVGSGEAYAVDLEEDGSTDLLVPFGQLGNPVPGASSQIGVAWGGDGRLLGIRCVPNGSGCQIQVIRDANDDHVLVDTGADEVVLGPTYTGTQLKLWGPNVRTDPSGNLVAGYVLRTDDGFAQVTVLHDRDGSGAFEAGPPETTVIQTLASYAGNFGKLAIDPAGRVAFSYLVAGPGLRIAYDRNGDGDYTDNVGGNPETFTAFNAFSPHDSTFCGGVAFDASGRLAAVFAESSAADVRVFRDVDGDGDFSGGGDVISVLGNPTNACDIEGHPAGGLAVAHGGTGGSGPELLVDRNDDGDFADATEEQTLPFGSSRLGVTFSDAARAWVIGNNGAFVDPL
jgi:hypothetical protein